MSSPLRGAWELISEGQEGFAVFTESHFNIYVVQKGAQGPGPAQDELGDASRTMRGSGGTYSVSGSTAVLHYLVTRVPNYYDRDLRIDFDVSDDTLTIRGTQPDGTTMAQSNWRKVG